MEEIYNSKPGKRAADRELKRVAPPDNNPGRKDATRPAFIYKESDAAKRLPKREDNSHKGTYGNVLMCTGSPGMYGAAVLCARAALKSGVGLVCQYADRESRRIFVIAAPEAVTVFDADLARKTQTAKAIVCGCGLGKSVKAAEIVNAVKKAGCPKVLDADALNIISIQGQQKLENTVITPHPAEAARLLGVTVDEIQADRIAAANTLAQKFGCAALLKGAFTVIAAPDRDTAVIACRNSGLSKGGSGDCLSGIIGSLAAQGLDIFDAACLGAYIHGRAAYETKEKLGEHSMQPSDLIDNLHIVFKKLKEKQDEITDNS